MSKPFQSLWMLVATAAFAVMAACVKMAVPLYSSAEILFYRALISALLVAAFALATGLTIRTPHWATHSRRAIYGTYAMGTWYYTLGVLPLATSVTLNYTSPIFVALLSAFAGWRASRAGGAASSNGKLAYLAIALGFVGVVVLLNPRVSSDHIGASLLGLSAGFVAAFSFRDIRRLVALGEPEWRLVFYFAVNSSVYAFIAMWFGEVHSHSWRGAALLLGTGFFGTIGQLAVSRSFGRGHVLLAASLQYSGVVFAAILGLTFFDEYLPAQSWIGIAIITAAGLLATVATRRSKGPEETKAAAEAH